MQVHNKEPKEGVTEARGTAGSCQGRRYGSSRCGRQGEEVTVARRYGRNCQPVSCSRSLHGGWHDHMIISCHARELEKVAGVDGYT